MAEFRTFHMRDRKAFSTFSRDIEERRPALRFGRIDLDGEATLTSDCGGMKVFWLYAGAGEVYLPAGFRTKEGDGQRLPPEYEPEPTDAGFAADLVFLDATLGKVSAGARGPVQAILSRRSGRHYIGDYANDLWKLEHTPVPWSDDDLVAGAIGRLFGVYRSQGISTKTVGSYELIMAGDQLVVAGAERLKVRGHFGCLTVEQMDRAVSHIPGAMRLRYLKDSSGGCNFDFDPFRRLPLTWYMNLNGETGDGVNFVNSHVVNIAKETSPTHFHPRAAIGGGLAQNEMYLVLDPKVYGLETYGRRASILILPDLRDLSRYEEHALEGGSFVYIPAGMGHRGMDVFVNVITIPGFKPHNEYYLDREIRDTARGASPCNSELLGLKNYTDLAPLIA